MTPHLLPSEQMTLSYVEFYCGVGGWTMALNEAVQRLSRNRNSVSSIKLQRLAALDHSNLCVSVLEHNFPSRVEGVDTASTRKRKLPQSFDIQRLTLQQVHNWHADIWCMSPPCQPHTRQHDKQDLDLDDSRSQSFLHICQLLQDVQENKLPKVLLMENVVGFEKSGSCRRWRTVLQGRNYSLAHFHLTPTQVGLPNDRPRYFCVAVRTTTTTAPEAEAECWWTRILSTELNLDIDPQIQTQLPELGVLPVDAVGHTLPPLSSFLDTPDDDDTKHKSSQPLSSLRVPAKLLDTPAAWCFDTVTPDDTRSACFTHSYGTFVRGTGSVLYTGPAHYYDRLQLQSPQDRVFDASWKDGLNLEEHLRYFSGREMANLMGFVDTFSFPDNCGPKQQRKLLGNSLNVRVAARLSELALTAMMMLIGRVRQSG